MSVEDGIPEEGQAAPVAPPSHDWEKDYKELQATYTQSQQRLKDLERYEQDPQAYYELGAKHGVQFEFEDQQQQSEGVDPDVFELRQQNTAYEQRIAQIEARIQKEEHAASMAQFRDSNAAWAKEAGIEFDKADDAAIFGLLLQSPDPNDPDIHRRIFDEHAAHVKARDDAKQAAWEEARKRPRVPTPPTGGTAHTGTPNWGEMSQAEIDEYMAARMAGNA